jgi:hypothetical protein
MQAPFKLKPRKDGGSWHNIGVLEEGLNALRSGFAEIMSQQGRRIQ